MGTFFVPLFSVRVQNHTDIRCCLTPFIGVVSHPLGEKKKKVFPHTPFIKKKKSLKKRLNDARSRAGARGWHKKKFLELSCSEMPNKLLRNS